MGGMPRPGTEQVRPLQAPPYLASQTAARMDAPIEPWAGSLKLLMIIFGLVLVACFAAPHAVSPKMIFSWTGFGDQPTKIKVANFLVVGVGFLGIVLGLLPLAVMARGLGAALLGLAPTVYGFVIKGKAPEWYEVVTLVGTLTLVSGLLIRSQYRSSMAGRIMTTIGAIAVLVVFLVPMKAYGDKMLLVAAFKAIGDAPGKHKLEAIVALLPFFLALVSLLVWLPAPSSAASLVFAWCWIVLPIVVSLTTMLVAGHIGDQLKGNLKGLFWAPAEAMALTTFVGYGIATMVGKNLEHS